MRDYLAIIRRNFISPIVVAIFILAGALLYVGEYRDAWFISVVIVVNSLIGVIQEFRAKLALRKLELMTRPMARVVRDESLVDVAFENIAVGDEIQLLAGDEVPADCQVVFSQGLEIDESMLTGESLSVEKSADDEVSAATVVVAGSGRAVVQAVGKDTKAEAMSSELKRYKPELTPLQKAIQKAITVLTIGAVVLAAMIFVAYSLSGQDSVSILKTITSAAVTVVPEGLLLASSMLLAFGSIKLAQAKVLPQKLSAIEATALLNLLCVDKTGTLTSDEIKFSRLEAFGDSKESELSAAASLISAVASGGNATGRAISQAFTEPKGYDTVEVLAFSSQRKMSGVRARTDGVLLSVVMGAPEYVNDIVSLTTSEQKKINTWTAEGHRVLVVAKLDETDTPLKDISKTSGKILGAVLLSNPLREGVAETVKFLQNSGVGLRVISGDNPATVQHIAQKAGIDKSNLAITGVDLAKLSGESLKKAYNDHTIFARVLPEQKRQLIEHFKSKNLFTGMVGDGVNDALALKTADLGIAMYAGAPASRRVADLILLNNSFTALPMGMKLGNRIMQAIEVIATLFFHKIIYGIILLSASLLAGATYPFEPRHITFMNMFLVTMPTLMWAFFPPLPKHRVNPRYFWRDTLLAVLPIAIVTGLTVAFTYGIMSIIYPDRPVHVATMTVLTATFFGVYMVFLVGPMLGVSLDKAALRARKLYLVAVILVSTLAFGVGSLRDFFDFSAPTIWILWPAVGVIFLAAYFQRWLAKRAGKKFSEVYSLS